MFPKLEDYKIDEVSYSIYQRGDQEQYDSNRTMDFPQSHDLLIKQPIRPDKPQIPY